MVVNPLTIAPDAKLSDALDLMTENKISAPVTEKGGKLVGILTNRDALSLPTQAKKCRN